MIQFIFWLYTLHFKLNRNKQVDKQKKLNFEIYTFKDIE